VLRVVPLLQSAQDLELGRIEGNRDAVVGGRGATFDSHDDARQMVAKAGRYSNDLDQLESY
jgi:hypothetical protein